MLLLVPWLRFPGSLSADVVLVSCSGGCRLRGVLLAVPIGLSCYEAQHRSWPFVTNSIGGKGSGVESLVLRSGMESLDFAPVVSSSSVVLCLR